MVMAGLEAFGEPDATPWSEEEPDAVTMQMVERFRPEVIAEIGVWKGGTTRALAEFLDGKGELHLFDFEEQLADVAGQLANKGYRNVVLHPNTTCTYDSYNWSLMQLVRDNPQPIFDYVYLDGAHTWAVDGFAFYLVDRLLKVGGYLDFDDYDWSMASSSAMHPRSRPETTIEYTTDQINTPNIKLVVDLLVRPDPRYVEVVPKKVFRKVAPTFAGRTAGQRLRRAPTELSVLRRRATNKLRRLMSR